LQRVLDVKQLDALAFYRLSTNLSEDHAAQQLT
jgi:hypothetical protein